MKLKMFPPCRFGCKDPAVGIFYIKEGCICWPDHIQALCMQHFITAESEGDVLEIISFEEEDEENGNGDRTIVRDCCS